MQEDCPAEEQHPLPPGPATIGMEAVLTLAVIGGEGLWIQSTICQAHLTASVTVLKVIFLASHLSLVL